MWWLILLSSILIFTKWMNIILVFLFSHILYDIFFTRRGQKSRWCSLDLVRDLSSATILRSTHVIVLKPFYFCLLLLRFIFILATCIPTLFSICIYLERLKIFIVKEKKKSDRNSGGWFVTSPETGRGWITPVCDWGQYVFYILFWLVSCRELKAFSCRVCIIGHRWDK